MGVSAIAGIESGRPPDSLVARAKAGDFSAFEELYRQHVGRVYALCLRMTADPARAEDHTQEAFVRAWRALDSFREESGFPTWLRRVTINVVLGDRRSRGRREDRERPLNEPAIQWRRTSGPVSGLDLERAVAGLPAGARRVFVLHDVEGYRHDEVAGMLDVTPGTSKAQLHRARKLLREALRR
jgi:RNA polymerase sigma-70 factor (ECF subfamily)